MGTNLLSAFKDLKIERLMEAAGALLILFFLLEGQCPLWILTATSVVMLIVLCLATVRLILLLRGKRNVRINPYTSTALAWELLILAVILYLRLS